MEDNEKEVSFEELLNQSEAKSLNKVQTGQKINGTVVMLSKDGAYIDIGMRTEAFLPIEPGSESGLSENQAIDVYVVNASGQVQLSLEPVLGFGDFSKVQEANEKGVPIEGRVGKVIPGGYEVSISGVRCFCPHSQINLRPIKDPGEMVGQDLLFKIIELDNKSSNVVLSRRALQEEEQAARVAEIREKLVVGNVLKGTVADTQAFGAFIDLGGIHGLLHVSEIAYQNVAQVSDVLSPGDELDVKILDISVGKNGKDRISLSRKALLPNPWESLTFQVGDEIQGTVVRKSKFGVFINVTTAIDGLLPRRMMKNAGKAVEMDEFNEGEELTVEVVEIDRNNRKIALALPGWNEEIKSEIRVGDSLKVEVIKVLPVGILVQGLEDPAKGLIHKRTLRDVSMKQIHDEYAPGRQLEVTLEDRDSQGRLNFVLKREHDVDGATLSRFVDGSQDLGHNPFAAFFNQGK